MWMIEKNDTVNITILGRIERLPFRISENLWFNNTLNSTNLCKTGHKFTCFISDQEIVHISIIYYLFYILMFLISFKIIKLFFRFTFGTVLSMEGQITKNIFK